MDTWVKNVLTNTLDPTAFDLGESPTNHKDKAKEERGNERKA